MALGNFDGLSFASGTGNFDVDSTADTHDGHSGRKRVHEVPGFDEKRYDEERGKRAQLRELIERAIDPQAFPVPAEAAELAAPFAERLESGRIAIDWTRLEREAVIRAQLYAAAEAYERERRAFEDDEEDVAILLTH